MKAMILAAGLGTRLRPLTDDRPKALVEVAGRTLLEITLSRLSALGIRDVIINVHHFADKIVDYLKFTRQFNAAFPGFDTDVHGLVEDDSDEGRHGYFVDCVAQD